MASFEICNMFHLVHVFFKNFELRGREGEFPASYSGDLGLVFRPGIRLFWRKIFLFLVQSVNLNTEDRLRGVIVDEVR